MSLVSIVMPAFEASTTIARAVASALSQTHADLEILVVSDDQHDYAESLSAAGVADARIRHLSSGKVAGGAPRARNLGLAAARGDFVTLLDADDVMRPRKLELLLPHAARHGAAFDDIAVVDDSSGQELHRAFRGSAPPLLDLETFFTLDTPLVGLMRRDRADPQDESIAVAEDVLMNLLLIDTLGTVPVVDEALSEYRVVQTSLCNDDQAVNRFETAYARILAILPELHLSPHAKAIATAGFTAKRERNRAYAKARAAQPGLSFQDFAAQLDVRPSA